ncbi:thioredoxin family protein [Desulfovibrio sp. OttesenSCG-928-M14]|nr:thioredoxin family protein [Desulfovibrio sp. OttesenSCG-928-M16]MDL2216512.1 thioredoxin family protein [Desulfovibrio sp. OttesenSCG-928-M14]
MLEIDKDIFESEVEQSALPVVLDFWGPQCGPCLALMPDVEKLAESYAGKVKFAKVNVSGNRRLCIALKVMSVPTFLFYKGGEIVDRLSGDDVSLEAVKAKTDALLA